MPDRSWNPIDTLYEFVDLWSYLVHSRPDQDLMFAEGPGWTGLNRIQLQPCVQPLVVEHDLDGHPRYRMRIDSMRPYMTNSIQP